MTLVQVTSSVFGPAQFRKAVTEASQRKTDYVEVAAFDAGNVAAGTTLDGVGAGFVKGFFGREIVGEFVLGERGDVHVGGFDEPAAIGVGQADDGDASYDGMDTSTEPRQHLAGVVGGPGFPEDFPVDEDGGVCGDDDCGADRAGGDEFGFGVRKSLNQILGRLAGNGGFIDRGGEDRKGEAGIAEDFGTSR